MDEVNPPNPPDGPPLAAEFAGLEAQAMAIEGDAAPPPAGPPQPTAGELAAELLDTLTMLREMAAPTVAWWDAYRTVWSDRALRAIADAGAVVMQRHGWTMGELFASWGPYIGLAAATLPPSIATLQAIRAHREQPRMPAPAPAA